jgi:hypothetical protein
MVQKIGQNGSYIACMDKECGYIHRAPKKGADKKEPDKKETEAKEGAAE